MPDFSVTLEQKGRLEKYLQEEKNMHLKTKNGK